MPYREIPPLPTATRDQARSMRKVPTDAESRLWYRLRSGRLGQHKFRRQYPIPPYIADFCWVAAKLVVELDGSQHGAADVQRDDALRRRGFRVLRFWNNAVFERLDDVLTAILAALQDPTLTPGPSPTGEGRKDEREQPP